MPTAGRGPDRGQLATTIALGVAAVAVFASADFEAWVKDLGFVLLEVIGRVLDRPTSLVVAGYAVVVAAAAAIELRGDRPLRRELLPTHLVVCLLALLGQAYLFVFAAQLRLTWLLVALLLTVSGSATYLLRRSRSLDGEPANPVSGTEDCPLPRAPVVSLFVLLHVLVEGAAGHILTPWLHAISDAAARFSRVPVLYWPLVVVPSVVGPAALGWLALRRGLRPLDWPHYDPRRLVDLAAIPSLAALAVVGLHYTTTMWGCPSEEPLSRASGAFDLEASADGATLLGSLREGRELLVVDLGTGAERRISTARPTDTLFDRTEPEILHALPDGDFLVLLASSDSEQGNGLARFDPETGTLGTRLAARGVSDVVDGPWISTEFAGRLLKIDPATGETVERLDVSGAETNKVLVEGGSAWSVGLWMDPYLRRVDLSTGDTVAWTEIGTHQWDLALSRQERVIFVPRLLDGRLYAFDAETLEPRGSLPDRFGVRPVEMTPDGQTVVTGNLYTGRIVGRSVTDGSVRFDRRIGGHVKSLEVSVDGRIFAGSNCGVFELTP